MTSVSEQFRKLLKELFSRLPASATHKIIFCFTFSRLSLFEPGDAFGILVEFLQKTFTFTVEDFNQPHDSFCYLFIDNEAYRYLAAVKRQFKFNEQQIALFEESWSKSCTQIKELLIYLFKAEDPLELEEMFTLERFKQMILNIAEAFREMEIEFTTLHNESRINDHNSNVIKQESGKFCNPNIDTKIILLQ